MAKPPAAKLMPGGRAAKPAGRSERPPLLSPKARAFVAARAKELAGFALGCVGILLFVVLGSYNAADPSWNTATTAPAHNLLGVPGAWVADILRQTLGWAAWVLAIVPLAWGWRLGNQKSIRHPLFRLMLALWGVLLAAVAFEGYFDIQVSVHGQPGGLAGAMLMQAASSTLFAGGGREMIGTTAAALAGVTLFFAFGFSLREWLGGLRTMGGLAGKAGTLARSGAGELGKRGAEAARAARTAAGDMMRREPTLGPAEREAPASPTFDAPAGDPNALRASPRDLAGDRPADPPPRAVPVVAPPKPRTEPAARKPDPRQPALHLEAGEGDGYELPPLDLLQLPTPAMRAEQLDEASLRRNAEELERVLADFGVRGEVQKVHPGPVVTLYELEPAPAPSPPASSAWPTTSRAR